MVRLADLSENERNRNRWACRRGGRAVISCSNSLNCGATKRQFDAPIGI